LFLRKTNSCVGVQTTNRAGRSVFHFCGFVIFSGIFTKPEVNIVLSFAWALRLKYAIILLLINKMK